jgi:hypothetical protein
MIFFDANLQVRHHIVTANIVSTGFLCAFILLLPVETISVKLATFFIFADPALIGMSFVGGMVLMEKAARVHSALGVTPSPPWVYLASRIVTLTIAGTLSGLAVAAAAYGLTFDTGAMIWALLASNIVAVLFGFVLAARSRSMNDLMIRLLYATTLLFSPLLPHFGLTPDWLGWLMAVLPTSSMLALFDLAGRPGGDVTLIALHSAYLAVWAVIAWIWSLREYRNSVLSEGR